ncbi:MAG TPA: ROK family protein [Candidatus Omnitrophota bacterium]|nr:ROK family protein [Candidatus Omnitrophota bacterium]HPD84150.1 ROK family protein [Candidatus Omnitrophota bacterium]HRZ03007.1 ROK family protein [Candidatus Omnitrophota bacterium]
MRKSVLAIDVGGTNIKLGLVSPSGHILSRTNLPTTSFIRRKENLIGAVVSASRRIIAENRLNNKDVLGIGIGLPGLVDARHGTVEVLTNIPGWKNVPLKKIIESRLKIPAFVDNDANVVTLGEWRFGAGHGFKNMICITLGTGVGGGLVIDNTLYRGEGFSAGEIGHIPLNETGLKCNCGGYGCLETYIGNQRLLKRARIVFKDNDISLEEISRLASRKNRIALRFWKEVAVHLGNGLAGVVNLLNPRCIVIGGGISNAHQYLFKTIRETLLQRALRTPAGMVKIVKAKLGSDAGLIGAQVLVHDALL